MAQKEEERIRKKDMTTEQIQKRNGKARRLKVIIADEGQFAVESSEGKIFYTVSIADNGLICSCADFIRNHKSDANFMCKHILAVNDCDGIYDEGRLLEKRQPKLDGRFIKNIQGRDFVLYAGLLDYAHQKGLMKLECVILQRPNKDNGDEAVCTATAETKNGEVFVDVGDANPRNTNKMIASHIIRMASTRAKARALRDLTNIGMTCLEELGDLNEVIGGEHPEASKPKKLIPKRAITLEPETHLPKVEPENADTLNAGTDRTISESRATAVHEKPKPAQTKDNSGKCNGSDGQNTCTISEAQRRATINLARRRGVSIEELETMVQNTYGTSLSELTSQQASQFIRQLQQSAA